MSLFFQHIYEPIFNMHLMYLFWSRENKPEYKVVFSGREVTVAKLSLSSSFTNDHKLFKVKPADTLPLKPSFSFCIQPTNQRCPLYPFYNIFRQWINCPSCWMETKCIFSSQSHHFKVLNNIVLSLDDSLKEMRGVRSKCKWGDVVRRQDQGPALSEWFLWFCNGQRTKQNKQRCVWGKC